jgi:hypothetical protein
MCKWSDEDSSDVKGLVFSAKVGAVAFEVRNLFGGAS